MIHKVIAEVDRGDPLLVKEIQFIEGVDEDMVSLEQRIHEIEYFPVLCSESHDSNGTVDTRLLWKALPSPADPFWKPKKPTVQPRIVTIRQNVEASLYLCIQVGFISLY